MDTTALGSLALPGVDGAVHRLGDLWRERPIVLVFLRHFGWLHCREHAAQLRQHHELIRALGGEIVAIGTGNIDYALSFVAEERIPYLVLVDDDAQAAAAASVPAIPWRRLLHPRSWRATWATYRRGHRVHAPGARVQQVGATFVVGPGDRVRYAHVDADGPDHAQLDDVLSVVGIATLRP